MRAEIKRRFRLSRCLKISNKDRIKQLVETICAERIDITVNYGDWFAIGCILAGMFEEEEKNCFMQSDNFIRIIRERKAIMNISNV